MYNERIYPKFLAKITKANDEIQLKDRFVPLIQAHLIDDKIMQMIDNLNVLQENESSKVYWYTWR